MSHQTIHSPIQTTWEPMVYGDSHMQRLLHLMAQDCARLVAEWACDAYWPEYSQRAKWLEDCFNNRTTAEYDGDGNYYEIENYVDEIWAILPQEYDNLYEEDLDYIMEHVRDVVPDMIRD